MTQSSSIVVVSLDLPQIESFAVDPLRFDGMRVAAGALPPQRVLDGAARALREGKPRLWFSPFVFVEERLRIVVGSGGFKGFPVGGRVEIGYGVAEELRGRGFATSGVRALLQLAFSEPDIVAVCAETALDNLGSRRVVEKLGFQCFCQRSTEDDGVVDLWLKSR